MSAARCIGAPASAAVALLLSGWLAVGCGGQDRGRPQALVNSAPESDAGVDPCAAADGLTFQSITTFDPPLGATRSLSTALCDPGVNLAKQPCMYFNFDGVQSPRSCKGVATTSPETCLQSDASHMPDEVCSTVIVGPDAVNPATSPGATLPVSAIPGGRCGSSNYAFHLVASKIATCYHPTTLKQGWGITLQLAFNPTQMNSGISFPNYDGSAWNGVSFWARRGDGPSGTSMLSSIQDRYSAPVDPAHPQPNTCVNGGLSATGGTDCFVECLAVTDEVLRPGFKQDANKCDPFGNGVLLTPEWRLIKLPFNDVHQKGFGVPSPLGHLDPTVLAGVKFELSAGDWDVWIDDIAFYREP